MRKRSKAWTIFYTAFLVIFTLYISLDTFVLSKAYTSASASSSAYSYASSEETFQNTEDLATLMASSEALSTSLDSTEIGTYSDDNMNITVSEYNEYDTSIYVADIYVSSPEYLKTALAEGTYGKNITETTSDIADEVDAILAVNGDYYGAQEDGYVIRDGVLYRDKADEGQEDLVISTDGSFKIINESDVTADELLSEGAWQVLSFGPGLLSNGEISVSQNEEVGKAMTSNPRTAIGMIDENHYVLVVSDGRTSESEGLTLYQLATFMQDLGVQTAYNLDGGGSSTMYFKGEVINNPTTNGNTIKERKVSDIVYIG